MIALVAVGKVMYSVIEENGFLLKEGKRCDRWHTSRHYGEGARMRSLR